MKEIDPTDWQSVVKGMLSIHLPSSHLQPHPINTASAHQDTFTASNSFKTLASYVSGPELESLQSGSPKVSSRPRRYL